MHFLSGLEIYQADLAETVTVCVEKIVIKGFRNKGYELQNWSF